MDGKTHENLRRKMEEEEAEDEKIRAGLQYWGLRDKNRKGAEKGLDGKAGEEYGISAEKGGMDGGSLLEGSRRKRKCKRRKG